MNHKGYWAGPIAFDADDGVFSGTVAGIRDVVHFEGTTADELRQAFRDSVDDYLAMCREYGRDPQTPCSGKVALRMSPELHHRTAMRAEADGMSLNAWIAQQLEEATSQA
jgi:predicted HicB family RNase H-like nuclease